MSTHFNNCYQFTRHFYCKYKKILTYVKYLYIILYILKIKEILHMENTIKELFHDNFDYSFKAAVYYNIKTSLKAFNQFIIENGKFFTYEKKKFLYGYLRTYALEKQFNDSAFNPNASYSVCLKQVSRNRHMALCIEVKIFLLNLGHTETPMKLLQKSHYKKEFSKSNSGISNQYELDFKNGTPELTTGKKYAQITYGYKHGNITHLNIILPSYDYKSIEDSIDLLEDVKVYNNYVPKETEEEVIVSLKEGLIKKSHNI